MSPFSRDGSAMWTRISGTVGLLLMAATMLVATSEILLRLFGHTSIPVRQLLCLPGEVPAFDGITIVPDRRNDGTNVLCLPTDAPFRFTYGPGSFARHHAEARNTGAPVRVAPDRLLGADVDLPSDLADLVAADALTICG